jgi:hypothetical protein
VVNRDGLPQGLLDITDVVSLLPEEPAAEPKIALSATTSVSGPVSIPTALGPIVISPKESGVPAPKSKAFRKPTQAPRRL